MVDVRDRVSFADYWRLPDDLRAEFIDGKVVMSPPPTVSHQIVCDNLAAALRAVLVKPRLVISAAGWQLGAETHYRIPDLMVLDERPSGRLVTETPRIVIEVLSVNRADDLVRKAVEYAHAGVNQYWVVDPERRTLEASRNVDGRWELMARLGDPTDADPDLAPEVALQIGDGVAVHLSLADVFS